MRRLLTSLFVIALALALSLVLSGCWPNYVEQGYKGGEIELYADGKGSITEHGPGVYWVPIFGYDFVEQPTNVQRYAFVSSKTEESPVDESFKLVSKDNLEFDAGMSLHYYLNPVDGCLTEFYRKYKMYDFRRFSKRHARDILRENAKNSFTQREAAYIYGEGQPEVENEIERFMQEEFDKKVGLVDTTVSPADTTSCLLVDNVAFVELTPPNSVKEAVEAKMQAAQRAQEEKSRLQQQIYASRKDSIKAAQDAENNRMIAESVTEELIKYKRLTILEKKWNGRLPKYMGGSGSGMLLNVK